MGYLRAASVTWQRNNGRTTHQIAHNFTASVVVATCTMHYGCWVLRLATRRVTAMPIL